MKYDLQYNAARLQCLYGVRYGEDFSLRAGVEL